MWWCMEDFGGLSVDKVVSGANQDFCLGNLAYGLHWNDWGDVECGGQGIGD